MGRIRLRKAEPKPAAQLTKPGERKRREISPVTQSLAGIAVGGGMASAGMWLWFGLPVALVAAGLGVIAYFLLLFDVDEPGRVGQDDRDGGRQW